VGVIRTPTPYQWLGFAADRRGLKRNEYAETCDVYAVVDALAIAPVRIRDGQLHRQLAGVLARITRQLVVRPPSPEDRRGAALDTASLVAEMNGARLVVSDRERTQLAEATERDPGDLPSIRAWFERRLRILEPEAASERRDRALRYLGPRSRELPLLFVSCPVRGIRRAEDQDDLLELGPKIRELAELVAEAHGHDPQNQLSIVDAAGKSLRPPIRVEMPALERPWDPDARESCQRNRPLLWEANALIILGCASGSHSTGEELAMTPLDAPVLFVTWGKDAAVPTAVEGGLSLRPTDTVRVPTIDEAIAEIEAFLWRRWDAIVRSREAMDVRTESFRALAGEFSQRIQLVTERLSKKGLESKLRNAGFNPSIVEALCSPQGLALMPPEVQHRAAAVLAFSLPQFGAAPLSGRLSPDELDALDHYQDEANVPPAVIGRLRREAERQRRIGVLRLPLSLAGWREFHAQLLQSPPW
jgi:hypothetical protein